MKKTGFLLQSKRESANLSLSEVALATKINPKILTAIENGDEANLPAKTFLKGFVRSYAVYLKMDVDEVMKSYQEECGEKPPERPLTAPKSQSSAPTSGQATVKTRRRVADENSSGMRTVAVVVIVVLIGLIIGVRELIEKYQREKMTEATEAIKVSPLQQPPIVTDGTNGVTKPPEALAPAPQPTVAPEAPKTTATPPTEPPKAAETPKPEPPKIEPPKVEPPKTVEAKPPPVPLAVPSPPPAPPPVPVVKAAPPPPPATAVEATPPPSPTSPAPAPEPVAQKADDAKPAKPVKNEIILEALDKVDVKMKIKGETKQMSLVANQVHTIHSDQPVVLDVSDGGAINIIVNGVERGVPGDLGKPKQISVP